jgi:hypothetical protein
VSRRCVGVVSMTRKLEGPLRGSQARRGGTTPRTAGVDSGAMTEAEATQTCTAAGWSRAA